MIKNYTEKKAKGKIKMSKNENGNIVFSEQRFNEEDGAKYDKIVLETNVEHLTSLKTDLERVLATQKEAVADTQAQIKAIKEMIPDADALINPPAKAVASETTKSTTVPK